MQTTLQFALSGGKPLKIRGWTNWFFRLSAYTEPLLELLDERPEFILPEILEDPSIYPTEETLANLEFLVVQDIFLTETAEFAESLQLLDEAAARLRRQRHGRGSLDFEYRLDDFPGQGGKRLFKQRGAGVPRSASGWQTAT